VDELARPRAFVADGLREPEPTLPAVSAELSDHLGYELGEQPPEGEPNRRNGWTSKTSFIVSGKT
jgi:hypothetical protein